MKNIYIIGASGFGREVARLIVVLECLNILGFINDNNELQNTLINDISLVDGVLFFNTINAEVNIVIAVGNPIIQKKI